MIKLGIVMDNIAKIKPTKDSSLAMLLAAQARGWQLHYMEIADLFIYAARAYGRMRRLQVRDSDKNWYELQAAYKAELASLDVILMRKDPPFNAEYLAATHILQLAEQQGCLIVNKPQALRDANEKLYITHFAPCCHEHIVTSQAELIKDFLAAQQDIVLKPLDGMGGSSVFRLQQGDVNTNVIIETITNNGQSLVMVQRFLPEIAQGDKRILMLDGQAIPYALARIPAAGEFRGNLAAGGLGKGQPLTERDYWICAQLGPKLRERGLIFVGIDVIGDYLTEINVTSPTCIRELDRQFNLSIGDQLMDIIADKIAPGSFIQPSNCY